ncbi:hypothetical protein [Fictibacillus enclensis]|nr:hypothetical protein [Fictibacillus enclensis]
MSSAATGTSVTISIKQLGAKAGTAYLTVTNTGMSESGRTGVKYKAE